MSETYIMPDGVIQLEALVVEAVKDVELCDAAEQLAADEIARFEKERIEIEADLRQAEDTHQKIACDRVGAYWMLGRAITNLEAALAADKGKHSEDTPRKRAIELAGNNSRYQRAKDIGSFFNSKDDAEQAAKTQSFNSILKEIAEKKSEGRKAKGHAAPGRKPTTTKTTKVVKPVAHKASVASSSESLPTGNDQVVAEEETKTAQPSITPEELAVVNTFVAAVGGWERAIHVIEEGHKKWQQNQNG